MNLNRCLVVARADACLSIVLQRQPQASDGFFGTIFAFALLTLNAKSVTIIVSDTRGQP
jgi:hypothetical protein